MTSSAPAISLTGGMYQKPTVRQTAIVLVSAGLLPLAVHSIPTRLPEGLGVSLLPMYWVIFCAVYSFGLPLGLATSAAAVGLTAVSIGFANPLGLPTLGLEALIFALIAKRLIDRTPWSWMIAPMAYVVARLGSLTLLNLVLRTGDPSAFGWQYLSDLLLAGSGLVILSVINFVLVKRFPKPEDWDAV